MRALSATDDLIARVDGSGCDIKDLLLSELGPYGHVRFTLNGDPLFLPAKLAVSLALIFHELATNAGKYGAFSSARGLLQVSWSVSDDRLNITWDETEGPPVGAIGEAGFGTRLLNSALAPFDGKTEIAFLKTGIHCTMQCRIPRELNARIRALRGVDSLLMTIEASQIKTARLQRCPRFFGFHLTKTTRDLGKFRRPCRTAPNTTCRTPPRADEDEFVGDTELGILRDVFRMLPTGVTVQDEHGRFLLVNDAAAAQLGIAPAGFSKELDQRRQTGIELLRAGRAAVAEECFTSGPVKQVLLTTHRPVRIADRNLLLSSSADISEQKAARRSAVPLGLL